MGFIPLPEGKVGPGTFELYDRFKRKSDGSLWEVTAARRDSASCELQGMHWCDAPGYYVGWLVSKDSPRFVYTGEELFEQFEVFHG